MVPHSRRALTQFVVASSLSCLLVASAFVSPFVAPTQNFRGVTDRTNTLGPGSSRQSMPLAANQQRRGKGKAKAKASEPIFPTPQSIPPVLPKLLVFDLDNTLWTPELYQIRQRSVPKAGKDIWLFDGAQSIVSDLATNPCWEGVELALASRTNKGSWASTLLRKFEAAPGISLDDLFPHQEIVTGSKRKHFESLRQATGIQYKEMLFFDDDMHMNLGEISQMGVLCCHCPKGMTVDLFRGALSEYHDMKSTLSTGGWMGMTLTSAGMGLADAAGAQQGDEEGRKTKGRVKFYSSAKRFGFVLEDGGSDEFFFHESKVAGGLQIKTGMAVEFETLSDPKGRSAAAILSVLGEGKQGLKSNGASAANTKPSRPKGNKGDKNSKAKGETVRMPCFSMSQPFAALLLNGVKTIETRNNPMFMDLRPGTKVLMHCGRRDWPDKEAPKVMLREAGYSDEDINRLSSLPSGFSKGSIIGVMEVGKTWLTAERERRGPNMQRRVVASFENMGKYCTLIENANWLKKPVKAGGSPGVYFVDIPKSSLPDE